MHDECSNSNLNEHLAQLESLSQQMLQMAGEKDWSSLGELENRQQQLAKELFELPIAADEVAAVQTTIKKLLVTNQTITDQATASRQELSELANNIGKGRKAINAYQGNS
jgi:septal ring factor EnvC (AmiA/AmiB activator)